MFKRDFLALVLQSKNDFMPCSLVMMISVYTFEWQKRIFDFVLDLHIQLVLPDLLFPDSLFLFADSPFNCHDNSRHRIIV